jgi:hypothetical protein
MGETSSSAKSAEEVTSAHTAGRSNGAKIVEEAASVSTKG